MASKVLIVDILETGEKVSVKYKPSCWVKPLGTSLALYLSMVPLDLYLQTHLHPIAFLCGGKGVRVQV